MINKLKNLKKKWIKIIIKIKSTYKIHNLCMIKEKILILTKVMIGIMSLANWMNFEKP